MKNKILILVAALVALALSPTAQADRSDSDKLWLARMLVAEMGWEPSEQLAAAAHATVVNRAQAHRRTYRQGLNYSVPMQRDDGHRDWVRHLRDDNEAPRGWPGTRESWERFRPQWVVVRELASRVYDGEVRHNCDGEPWHWGSVHIMTDRQGLSSLRRQGFVLLDCGDTGPTRFLGRR